MTTDARGASIITTAAKSTALEKVKRRGSESNSTRESLQIKVASKCFLVALFIEMYKVVSDNFNESYEHHFYGIMLIILYKVALM